MKSTAVTWTRLCGCVVTADPWADTVAQQEQQRRNRPTAIQRACGRHAQPALEPDACTCGQADCGVCMKRPGPLAQPVPAQRVLYATPWPGDLSE